MPAALTSPCFFIVFISFLISTFTENTDHKICSPHRRRYMYAWRTYFFTRLNITNDDVFFLVLLECRHKFGFFIAVKWFFDTSLKGHFVLSSLHPIFLKNKGSLKKFGQCVVDASELRFGS